MTSPEVQQTDADLWKAYAIRLKTEFAQGQLGENERFYVAPLSAAGIGGGRYIDTTITNDGLFNVADSLLDLENPVFLPTRQSYFERARSYVSSIYLASKNEPGLKIHCERSRDAADRAASDLQRIKERGKKAWKKDIALRVSCLSFLEWVTMNYPQFSAVQAVSDVAVLALTRAISMLHGPPSHPVIRSLSALNSADGMVYMPGMTMRCCSASADQMTTGQAGRAGPAIVRPSYEIDDHYSTTVDKWIGTFHLKKDRPMTISFTASEAAKLDWRDAGFSDPRGRFTSSSSVFFSITYVENNREMTKNFSSSELDSSMAITLTATDLGTFAVTAGNWNPSQLLGMTLVPNADPNLSKPMAYITRVLLAYGVGLKILLSSDAAQTITDCLRKAASSGGSAYLFGYNIGLGGSSDTPQTSTATFDQVLNASSGTTIVVPSADNAYPTLLGAFGMAIPLPGTK